MLEMVSRGALWAVGDPAAISSLGQKLLMMVTLMLTRKGVAVRLAIDAVTGMARTSLSGVGNCLANAVVAR